MRRGIFGVVLVASSFALALALGACSFEPRDGQFRCDDGASCPTGLVCIAAECVHPFDAATSTDAGLDGGADGGFDAAVADGGPDGGADAGPPPCTADFCANFDDVTLVDDGWTIEEVVGTGVIERVEVADAPSVPAVFRSSIDVPPPTAGYHAARLSFQPAVDGYETATPVLRLSFRMRVVEFVENPGTGLAGLRYGAAEKYVGLALNPNMDTGGINLTYVTPDNAVIPLREIALNTWITIRIAVAPRSGEVGELIGPGVTISVDGSSRTLMGFAPGALSRQLRFDVGVSFSNPDSRAATVEYDDVEIDYLTP